MESSARIMTREELEQYQIEVASVQLGSLMHNCRSRYLQAADLVQLRIDDIDKLRDFGIMESVNLAPLIPSWDCICDRYLAERYDPQPTLFEDHDEQCKREWNEFVYWRLIPTLLRDDEFVRNVLRALGGLPCQSPPQAAASTRQYFQDMVLPE